MRPYTSPPHWSNDGLKADDIMMSSNDEDCHGYAVTEVNAHWLLMVCIQVACVLFVQLTGDSICIQADLVRNLTREPAW